MLLIQKAFHLLVFAFFLGVVSTSVYATPYGWEQKFYDPEMREGLDYGYSVSISPSEDYAFVGKPYSYEEIPSGSVDVFKNNNGTWTLQQTLYESTITNRFGRSVAVNSNYGVVAIPYYYSDVSAIKIYYKYNNTKFYPEDLITFHDEGPVESVAIYDDRIVAGFPQANSDKGKVFVFKKENGVWTQEQVLQANPEYKQFGQSVSINGNKIAVGAPNYQKGMGYVFEYSNNTWIQKATLFASDWNTGDKYGYSISLFGNVVAIGSPNDDNKFGNNAGSIYVYSRINGVWGNEVKLLASDGATEDWFGYSVSLNSTNMTVGSPYDDNDQFNKNGSVYIFRKNSLGWKQVFKLLPEEKKSSQYFGSSVSLSENYAFVGAPHEQMQNGVVSGAAYAYQFICTPQAISPLNNTIVYGKPVKIQWNICHGGTLYYQAKLNGPGVNWMSNPVMAITFFVNRNFISGSQYVWGVRACSDINCTKYSPWYDENTKFIWMSN